MTVAAKISGSGQIVKRGDGTLIQSGANSNNGVITVDGGQLEAGYAKALRKSTLILSKGELAASEGIQKINVMGDLGWRNAAKIVLTLNESPKLSQYVGGRAGSGLDKLEMEAD